MPKGRNSKANKYAYKRILKGNSFHRTNKHFNLRKNMLRNSGNNNIDPAMNDKIQEYYNDLPCMFPCLNKQRYPLVKSK